MRITNYLWAAAIFLAVILLSLIGDPDDWSGPDWGGRLAVTGGFALGFALLALVRNRAPRISLVIASLGVCGYYAAGLPSLGMIPAFMVFLYAAAVVGHQIFSGVVAAGLFALTSILRILAGQDPQTVLGYELLANLALAALAVAVAEFVILHRALAGSQRKMQENHRKFADFASKASARAESDHRRAEERARFSLRVQDELAHHLALATLHGNAAMEAVAASHPASISLGHVREATAKALLALNRTVDALGDGEAATRSGGTLSNIVELASSLRDAGLRVDVSAPGVDLDDGLPLLVMRIVREAATNAIIHADTTHLVIFLRPQPPQDGRNLWHLSVRNDGVRPGSKDAAGGISLSSLRVKVMDAGGSMDWGRLGRHFLLSAEIWQPQDKER